jgi:hypothetical protein
MKIFLALALLIPAFAFAQDCSKAVPIMKSPVDDVKAAQAAATQKCEREQQLRRIALYQGAAKTCADSADERLKQEPTADRAKVYSACLKGHGYIVQ